MGVRMKPKRCGSLVDLQNRTPRVARLNKLLWPAVIVAGDQKSMPMNGCDHIERILNRDLHFVASAQADNRSKDRARVAIGERWLSLDEGVPPGDDLYVDGITLLRRIDQLRDW